ncbi:MAG: Spy/CpxP family protein refolding chaperone [Hyphomicrobiales bacterium]|nr:Spy/CpxP family protein refolding chaperone [Hyphomicrobiales bacterium]MBV8443427.1 Spy/CpxP family protein refolding chaperone [Hyphomicrobiales bacterium]
MKCILLGMFAVAAVSVSGFTLTTAGAQSDQQPSREERRQHWAADRETMVHARLAGMKAGLGLKADQENLWSPFASAIDDAFKSHTEAMEEMMKKRESGQRMSPVDRMDFMAGRVAEDAAKLKTISEAAKPLYASLDETQKRNFEVLGRDMVMGERAEWDYRGGDAGYSWEPYGWSGMMR